MPERTFRFTVPSVPASCLRPNDSGEYGKARFLRRQDARYQLALDWGNAIKHRRGELGNWDSPLFDGDVAIHLDVLWPPGRTGLDFDGLFSSLKKGIDQLQHQGVLEDDAQIVAASWSQAPDPERRGSIEVFIRG